jgi:hypothetical protein
VFFNWKYIKTIFFKIFIFIFYISKPKPLKRDLKISFNISPKLGEEIKLGQRD